MFPWRLLLKRHTNVQRFTCGCRLLHLQPKFVSKQFCNLTWTRRFSSNIPLEIKGSENRFALNIVSIADSGISNLIRSNIVKQLDEGPNEYSKQLVENLKSEVKNCLDSELVGLLTVMDKYKDTGEYDAIWKIVDDEGALRVPKSEPGVMLPGALKIFQMGLHYKSNWVWSCLKRFCRRMDKLSKHEVLQLMFLGNVCRKFPSQYTAFDLQFHLVPHFDNMTLDEMAVVAIAFFKTQNKLNNKVIMSKILRKLLEESETCSGMTLALLCKIIRYSMPLTLADELYVLQTRLTEVVPHIELRSLTHVALAGTNVLLCHEPLIRATIERLRSCLPDVRLKDLERILLVMSLFNLRDDDFVDRVIKEAGQREEEIVKYPKAFVCLVNYLTILQRFHFDFIDRVLSKTFIKDTYGINFRTIGGELAYIDKSVEVECPDYRGNRLETIMLKSSAKVMTFRGQANQTGTQQFSFHLEDVLRRLYGENNVTYSSVLPHYHFPDFVIGFRESDLRPTAPPQGWSTHRWGEVKTPPNQNKGIIWLVVIVGGWNTLIRNTGEPLGSMAAKIRQLTMIGYHPVRTSYAHWRESTDKEKYVRSVIDPALQDIVSKKKIHVAVE